MIETTDHDAGPPTLYSGPASALVTVRIDGRHWAMMPPGDPVADRLADYDMEGANHAPR